MEQSDPPRLRSRLRTPPAQRPARRPRVLHRVLHRFGPFRRVTPEPNPAGGYNFTARPIDLPPEDYGDSFRFAADLNNDGLTDIFTRTLVFLGRPDGGLNLTLPFPPLNPFSDIVEIADINADGNVDVASLINNGTVSVTPGLGNGRFGQTYLVQLGATSNPGSLAIFDLDADGHQDLICLNRRPGTAGAVAYGLGGDKFEPAILLQTVPNAGSNQPQHRAIAIGGFNSDGLADMIVRAGSTIVLYESTGPRQYAPFQTIAGLPPATHILPIDVNGEIALAVFGGWSVEIASRNAPGRSAERSRFLYPGTVFPSQPIDVNADGNVDIVSEGVMMVLGRPGSSCPADLSMDGLVNFLDFALFLTAYNDADPVADFQPDGLLNFTDLLTFLNAFSAGCP